MQHSINPTRRNINIYLAWDMNQSGAPMPTNSIYGSFYSPSLLLNIDIWQLDFPTVCVVKWSQYLSCFIEEHTNNIVQFFFDTFHINIDKINYTYNITTVSPCLRASLPDISITFIA